MKLNKKQIEALQKSLDARGENVSYLKRTLKNWKTRIQLFAGFIIFMWVFIYFGYYDLAYLYCGFICGIIFSDIYAVNHYNKFREISNIIVDWDKVKQLIQENTSEEK